MKYVLEPELVSLYYNIIGVDLEKVYLKQSPIIVSDILELLPVADYEKLPELCHIIAQEYAQVLMNLAVLENLEMHSEKQNYWFATQMLLNLVANNRFIENNSMDAILQFNRQNTILGLVLHEMNQKEYEDVIFLWETFLIQDEEEICSFSEDFPITSTLGILNSLDRSNIPRYLMFENETSSVLNFQNLYQLTKYYSNIKITPLKQESVFIRESYHDACKRTLKSH